MDEQIILVDEQDKEIGTGEKMQMHREGRLHRCISVFVFNSKGEMLLQQRAKGKYHSGGLWTNACCSHPRPGEGTQEAAHRRIAEEMGFVCELRLFTTFMYRAELDHGITEHEFDHVFVGVYDGEVNPDSAEVQEYKWVSIEDLQKDVKENPDAYTTWFKIILPKVLNEALTKDSLPA